MHLDLLEAASTLANIDQRRPRQANLRRSVSTLYYALFHYLIDCTCRSIVGTQNPAAPLRKLLSRAFQHNEMGRCCKSFQNGEGALPEIIRLSIPEIVIPGELTEMASAFCESQQLRRDADYDLSARFQKHEVVSLIEQTQIVIQQFDELPLDNPKRLFLSCLWSWDRLKGR